MRQAHHKSNNVMRAGALFCQGFDGDRQVVEGMIRRRAYLIGRHQGIHDNKRGIVWQSDRGCLAQTGSIDSVTSENVKVSCVGISGYTNRRIQSASACILYVTYLKWIKLNALGLSRLSKTRYGLIHASA